MGFLAPWMLLGALTAGVPIALHLIRRNKPTVVPWAAMDFLLRSVRETRSASRFRDMMLLVCRVFVLVLATLALARPLASWVPGTGPVDLALLLDVSGSMRTEEPTATGPRSRFSLARDEAERLVRALPAGSRVRLMPFGDRVEAGQTPSEPLEPALVLESLGRLRQTDLATRLEPALDMAADALAQSDMANKRLWIISDAPAAIWAASAGSLRALPNRLPGANLGWSRVGTALTAHVQLMESGPEGGLLLANTRQPWRVRLRNTGTGPARGLTVRLAMPQTGGADPAAQPADSGNIDEVSLAEIGPGQERVLHLEALLPEGRHGVMATVTWAGERWPIDGSMARVVEARSPRRVLVVERTSTVDPGQASGFFLEQALVALAGEAAPGETKRPLEVLRRSPGEIGELTDIDLVFLAGISPPGLPDESARQLLDWCKAGRLLVAWGPFTGVPPVVDNPWGNLFAGVDPAQIQTPPSLPDITQARGILAPFALPPLDRLGRVILRRLHSTGAEDPAEEMLLRTTAGAPLVRRQELGRGEVIRLDLGVDAADSDLVLSPIFPPLVGALSSRAGEVALADHNLQAGAPPRSPGLELGPTRLLRTTDSAETSETRAWNKAGIWRLEENGVPVRDAVWAVRGGTGEGDDLEPAPTSVVHELAGDSLVVVDANSTEAAGILTGQGGEAAWWILLVVLMLLLSEGLVARWAGGSL